MYAVLVKSFTTFGIVESSPNNFVKHNIPGAKSVKGYGKLEFVR